MEHIIKYFINNIKLDTNSIEKEINELENQYIKEKSLIKKSEIKYNINQKYLEIKKINETLSLNNRKLINKLSKDPDFLEFLKNELIFEKSRLVKNIRKIHLLDELKTVVNKNKSSKLFILKSIIFISIVVFPFILKYFELDSEYEYIYFLGNIFAFFIFVFIGLKFFLLHSVSFIPYIMFNILKIKKYNKDINEINIKYNETISLLDNSKIERLDIEGKYLNNLVIKIYGLNLIDFSEFNQLGKNEIPKYKTKEIFGISKKYFNKKELIIDLVNKMNKRISQKINTYINN